MLKKIITILFVIMMLCAVFVSCDGGFMDPSGGLSGDDGESDDHYAILFDSESALEQAE